MSFTHPHSQMYNDDIQLNKSTVNSPLEAALGSFSPSSTHLHTCDWWVMFVWYYISMYSHALASFDPLKLLTLASVFTCVESAGPCFTSYLSEWVLFQDGNRINIKNLQPPCDIQLVSDPSTGPSFQSRLKMKSDNIRLSLLKEQACLYIIFPEIASC